MLVTLWCFIGVEGAVVISSRAKNNRDVGKATVLGYLASLFLYALISIGSYGILKQPELAQLKDPSVGYLLRAVVGNWGVIFVLISVIISVLGGWISWTILCVEVPFTAAQVKILPKIFDKENSAQAPVFSLLISSIVMQIFMFLVVSAKSVYLSAVDLAGVTIRS